MKAKLPATHRRLLLVLAALYAVWWTYWAFSPVSRSDWWLENVLVFFVAAFLLITARWLVLSRLSYVLTFVFMCLHTLGSHYTYSEVPYDAWFRAATGWSPDAAFGWERNHFDRAVHFLYGLLITWPFREAFYRVATPCHAFWSYLFTLSYSMATSLFYELLEWAAAVLLGGETGMAFLGTQGDVWDAHRDMMLATTGALLCFAAMILAKIVTGRDFAREWGESQRPVANSASS